jgi:itaconyl-CoA hydratase
MSTLDLTTFELVRKGPKFEDFEVGQVLVHHWGRTITDGDNTLFSTAMCNWSPMYINAEFARAHGHPDMVVNPMMVLSTVVGLSVEDLSESGGPFLGVEDCTFHLPVYPGDTISARSTVMQKRISASRPTMGVVSWHLEGHNQRGELVIDFLRSNLLPKREVPE